MKRRQVLLETKEVKKRSLCAKHLIFNTAIKYLQLESHCLRVTASPLGDALHTVLQRVPRRGRISFIKNTCLATGQFVAVNRFSRLNRMQLKFAIERGLLAGVRHPK